MRELVDVNITIPLLRIIDLILDIFKFSYDFMRSINFLGTNLFSFTITIFLLMIILPILFTLVRSEAVHNQRFRERVNKMRSKRKGD